ncbi:hypothetical protein AB4653_04020 [Vibrio sp. 10N.222.48.A3]
MEESLRRRSNGRFYCNVDETTLQEIDGCSFHCLSLTPYEYRSLFSVLSIWNPDSNDDSVLLDSSQDNFAIKGNNSLIKWLIKYDRHLNMLRRETQHPNALPKPTGNHAFLGRWLERESIRLYPQGVVMDKQVFCQRWAPTHWTELLKQGLLLQEPKRNPALIKVCRKDPKRILLVEQIAFVLVNVTRTTVKLDWPEKQSTWMSNVELNAISNLDSKLKFTIEDVFTVDSKAVQHIQSNWVEDDTLQLSVTHGIATRNLVNEYKGTWTSVWWKCVERANWITIIGEVQRSHQIIATGFGNGYVSFFCWAGEVAQLCEVFKMKAAVLKVEEKEYDAEFQQEYIAIKQKQHQDEHIKKSEDQVNYEPLSSSSI